MKENATSVIKRVKQKGASLVEAVTYLAIAGVVAAGAVAMFVSASTSATSNQIAQDVNALKSSVKAMSLSGTLLTNITTTTLSAAGRLSKNLTNQTSTACSAAMLAPCATYGDGVGFKITGSATGFTISIDNLTQEICESSRSSLLSSGFTNTPACSVSGSAYTISFAYR